MKGEIILDKIDLILAVGIIPLDERCTQIHGHKENGVNYCVVSHFKKGNFIFDKIAHMAVDDLRLSNLNEKSDETSLGLDMDNESD